MRQATRDSAARSPVVRDLLLNGMRERSRQPPTSALPRRQLRTLGLRVRAAIAGVQSLLASRYAVSLPWSRPSSFTSYPSSLEALAAVKE